MSTMTDPDLRVFDAPSQNWVYRFLPRAVWPYAQLARLDRPIGWQLLLWPCLWSLALAANVEAASGHLNVGRLLWYCLLFLVGAVVMRGAGCTYNDLVDHDIDKQVERTRSRPLPSGRVSRQNAKLFILAQLSVGFVVLLCLNLFSMILAISSLVIVAVYPFAKRFTDWPQFFLGLAFSWGGLMGWAALKGSLSVSAILLYLAAVVWTIGYDTIYAHQDKEDDALIGVRSTARLFAGDTKIWLTGFYGAMFVLLLASFITAGIGFVGYLGLISAGVLLAYQITVLDIDNPAQCMALFKLNTPVGLILFGALILAIPFA